MLILRSSDHPKIPCLTNSSIFSRIWPHSWAYVVSKSIKTSGKLRKSAKVHVLFLVSLRDVFQATQASNRRFETSSFLNLFWNFHLRPFQWPSFWPKPPRSETRIRTWTDSPMGSFFNDDVESAQFCQLIRGGIFAHFSMFSMWKDTCKKLGRRQKEKKGCRQKNWRAREKVSSRLSFRDGPRGPQLWGPGRARARARALSTPAHTGISKISRVT